MESKLKSLEAKDKSEIGKFSLLYKLSDGKFLRELELNNDIEQRGLKSMFKIRTSTPTYRI